MVNIVCRGPKKDAKPINIVFLVHTGSPYILVSEGYGCFNGTTWKQHCTNKCMDVLLQSNRTTQCHLSPIDKHVADVNVLGMDFIFDNGTSSHLNCEMDTFELVA
jgi:hypothetical protein